MNINVSNVKQPIQIHTCRNCKNTFSGKICNLCGEKVFNEKQLTAKHFFHQVLDFFWHWENKVLKSIKLNTFKPGFITLQNFNGIRVPYAKPVQLYLVMSVVFFIGVSKIGAKDYIPSLGDHEYNYLSDYAALKWAKPLDEKIATGINNLTSRKIEEIENALTSQYKKKSVTDSSGGMWVKLATPTDSLYLTKQQIPAYLNRVATHIFIAKFNSNISTYGKSFIFALLPFMAAVFFLFFFSKIKYYGAALILAVHFMVYNMLFYLVTAAIYWIPLIHFDSELGSYFMLPFMKVFYNPAIAPVSTFLFGESFEFEHLFFWMPWFYFAFKRLFNTIWWKNILISWCCSRVFYYLIFGVLKKALIAFTLWSMH